MDVEYKSASVDKSSSSKPKTKMSGSILGSFKIAFWLIAMVGTSGGTRETGVDPTVFEEESKVEVRDALSISSVTVDDESVNDDAVWVVSAYEMVDAVEGL